MTIERRSPKRPRGPGSPVVVHCPCGYSGTRYLTSTQPCPSCTRPIDMAPARQAMARAQKKNRDRLLAEAERIASISSRSREERIAREAAEAESISAMLRASVAEHRPLRRTP